MTPADLVFNSVYKPAIKAGATEPAAKESAIQAMNDYKKSNYKSVKDLVDQAIKRAKKMS